MPRVTKLLTSITFIDLFSGIGGFRLAFERAGGECVFASDWDELAQKTYEANYGHRPAGDITQITASNIPSHDILTAGFPCQSFSIAGVSKHNSLGNAHGFKYDTQGRLFFDVARIIDEKRPSESTPHCQNQSAHEQQILPGR